MNVERPEDVLTHKRLLHLAEDPANRPVFEVCIMQVYISVSFNSIYYSLPVEYLIHIMKS